MTRYEQLAYRTAYLTIGDADEAADAAQSAFIKAYRALHRFRPGAQFRPWLLRIVANEARNRYRSRARHAALMLEAGAEHASAGAAPSAEAATLAAEMRREVVDAVNQMREQDRLVIGCRYFLELSEAETAAVLGLRRGTVKSRLARALGRLRNVLGSGHD